MPPRDMFSFANVAVGLFAASQVAAQSALYPSVDQTLLATALNISIGCLDALNTTVSCDPTLLQMAGNVDNYLWSTDNVTALCTSDCQSSAATWFSDVDDACADDLITVNARMVPPLTIPGRTLDGLNIACLTEDTDVTADPGVDGSVLNSTVTSQENSTVSFGTAAPSGTAYYQQRSVDLEEDASTPSYCLIESYSWEGSDIIRPDCDDPSSSNDTQCADPTDVPPENERIANLYPDSLLCSECFLKMFYLRVASPYLPDLDYSDYLVQQYYDIISVCNSTMPDLLVRALPLYQEAPGTIDGLPLMSDNTTSSLNSTDIPTSAAVACNQTLAITDLGQLDVPDASANGSVYCNAISEAYNVATGDLQLAFGNGFCVPTTNLTSVCVPAPCTLIQVPDNATCDSMAAMISTSSTNVTALQFTTWNPNLVGICDQLQADQYACASAPGGSYVSPPASNSTTNEGTQQRGGGDGSGTATGAGGVAGGGRNATFVKPGGAAPSPTQSGIIASCTEYAQASSGDGCYSLTSLWQITEANFYTWNTVLGPNGMNCSTALFAGYYYCIAIDSPTTTSSAPSGTTPTSSPTPSPVQSGIDPQCTAYAEAKSGDYCTAFASGNNITPAQLYTWNPVLGDNGANCNTQFQANTYYCIGAPAATPTSTTSTVSAPGPTQSGIAADCNKYAEAMSGDTCYDFAQENNITTTQLYMWNPALGSDGSNCANDFWANEYYCVGVSS